MAEKTKSFTKNFIKVILPLALGIAILYFLYAGTNFRDLWTKVRHAHWLVLSFSLIFGLLGNVIRGLRWELLIRPLGYSPRKKNLVYAVLGSYAVNFALPRAGEVWRCGVISKKENIPFTKLIGTLIIDRLFDAIMVLLIVLLSFLLNAALFYRNKELFNLPPFLTSPVFYAGCLFSLAVVVAVIVFFKNNPVVKKIRTLLVSIGNDIKIVWKMKEKALFIACTFGIWIAYFLYFYITFFAFDFTAELTFSAGLFIFMLSSISMGIPSNGGLGPWQAAVVFGLGAFMVGMDEAKAFATAVFAFQSVWIVACGLFGIAAFSFGNKK
jgi:uncharacterized protein (TIRG00374 family)